MILPIIGALFAFMFFGVVVCAALYVKLYS